MAKKVLQNICSPRVAAEQIPSLLVATGANSPDQDGIDHLKRRFEDNEADIISEIYSTHFRPRSDLKDAQEKDQEDEREEIEVRRSRVNPSPPPVLNMEKVNAHEEFDSI